MMIINKKLMALAVLFFLLSALNYWYAWKHPQIMAISVEEFAGTSVYGDDQIFYAVDHISSEGSHLKFDGWAFLENQDCESTQIAISLVDSAGHDYIFPTTVIPREDVAEAYENDFYAKSGFSKSCEMRGMPEGTYAVDLYLNSVEQGRYSVMSLPYKVCFDGEEITDVIEDEASLQ